MSLDGREITIERPLPRGGDGAFERFRCVCYAGRCLQERGSFQRGQLTLEPPDDRSDGLLLFLVGGTAAPPGEGRDRCFDLGFDRVDDFHGVRRSPCYPSAATSYSATQRRASGRSDDAEELSTSACVLRSCQNWPLAAPCEGFSDGSRIRDVWQRDAHGVRRRRSRGGHRPMAAGCTVFRVLDPALSVHRRADGSICRSPVRLVVARPSRSSQPGVAGSIPGQDATRSRSSRRPHRHRSASRGLPRTGARESQLDAALEPSAHSLLFGSEPGRSAAGRIGRRTAPY